VRILSCEIRKLNVRLSAVGCCLSVLLAPAAFKAAHRSLKSRSTGTLAPPFQRVERHVPDQRESFGGRDVRPELPVE